MEYIFDIHSVYTISLLLSLFLFDQQAGGAAVLIQDYAADSSSSGTFISCSWTGNTAVSGEVSDMFQNLLSPSTNFVHNNNCEFNHTKYSQYCFYFC
jgi:hypothetical protein